MSKGKAFLYFINCLTVLIFVVKIIELKQLLISLLLLFDYFH